MNKEGTTITVTVECCRDCHEHQWNTRHDEARYQHFFQECKPQSLSVQREASLKIGDAVFLRNFVPTKFLFAQVFKQMNKTEQPPSEGYQAIRPRVGAFEIYFETYCIYSKLTNGLWPHIPTVVKKLSKVIDAHQEGQDLSPYTIELKTSQSECKERSKRSSSRFSSISPPPQRMQRNSSKHRNFSPLRTSHRSPMKPATSSLQKFSRFHGTSSTKIISKTTTPSLMQSKGYQAPARYENKLISGDQEEPSKPMFVAQSVEHQPIARAISETQLQGGTQEIEAKTQDSVAQLPPLKTEPVHTQVSAKKQSGVKAESPVPVEEPQPPSEEEEESYKEEFDNEEGVQKKDSTPQLVDDNASDLTPLQERMPLPQKEYSVTSEHSPKKGDIIREIEPMVVFQGDLNEEPSLISYAPQQSSIHSHHIQDASFQPTLPNEQEFQKGFVNEPPSRIQTQEHSEVKEQEIVDAIIEKEAPSKDTGNEEYQQGFIEEITPPIAREFPPEEKKSETEAPAHQEVSQKQQKSEKHASDDQEAKEVEKYAKSQVSQKPLERVQTQEEKASQEAQGRETLEIEQNSEAKEQPQEKRGQVTVQKAQSEAKEDLKEERQEERDLKQNDSKQEEKSEQARQSINNEQKASTDKLTAKNDKQSEKKQEEKKGEKEQRESHVSSQKAIESLKQEIESINQKSLKEQEVQSLKKLSTFKNEQKEESEGPAESERIIETEPDSANSSVIAQKLIDATLDRAKESLKNQVQIQSQYTTFGKEKSSIVTISESSKQLMSQPIQEAKEKKEEEDVREKIDEKEGQSPSREELPSQLQNDSKPESDKRSEPEVREPRRNDEVGSNEEKKVKEESRVEESGQETKLDISKAESFHKSRVEAQLKEKGDQGEPLIEIKESGRQQLFVFEKAMTDREREKGEASETSEVAKSEQ